MPPKRRRSLRRRDVVDALHELGVLMGVHHRRMHAIGYSVAPPDPPPTLVVSEDGKIRAA
ncbi:hypothetical protein NA78x_000355 [Anatilimnocola sp. NA78]|uniref:hypothetical protein n=1 Tax=Anatilimnocola sp. NA78 TaxID=3415683 RepID=UPI003CE54135